MKIGEIAKLSGVSIRTIEYYTNCGLLAAARTKTNYRMYPVSVLQTIERIQLLKKQRMSISETKDILETNENTQTELLAEEVYEEFASLQEKIIKLEEQLKDAPNHVKFQISKALESKMVATASLLALL